MRITLLDKAVSSNLLYLDAIKHGLDKDPAYVADMQRFADGVLGGLYRQKYLIGDLEVRLTYYNRYDNRSASSASRTGPQPCA